MATITERTIRALIRLGLKTEATLILLGEDELVIEVQDAVDELIELVAA